MAKIEEPITIMGFAWIDDDGVVNWATREDMDGVKPKDRPKDCISCVIEITPTNEWVDRAKNEYDFLGDIAGRINQFNSDLEALQKSIKIGRE